MDVITRGSQQQFFFVSAHFRHGDEQTTNQVILEQAWEGSLLHKSEADEKDKLFITRQKI